MPMQPVWAVILQAEQHRRGPCFCVDVKYLISTFGICKKVSLIWSERDKIGNDIEMSPHDDNNSRALLASIKHKPRNKLLTLFTCRHKKSDLKLYDLISILTKHSVSPT